MASAFHQGLGPGISLSKNIGGRLSIIHLFQTLLSIIHL